MNRIPTLQGREGERGREREREGERGREREREGERGRRIERERERERGRERGRGREREKDGERGRERPGDSVCKASHTLIACTSGQETQFGGLKQLNASPKESTIKFMCWTWNS